MNAGLQVPTTGGRPANRVERHPPRIVPPRPAAPSGSGTDIWHEHRAELVSGTLDPATGIEHGVTILPAGEDMAERPPHARTLTLQQWEGTVEEVGDESFTGCLVDMSSENLDEFAEFPIQEVAAHDRELIAPGAVFYWWVGYRDSPGGRARQSLIRFRRLPGLTQTDHERVVTEARQLASKLGAARR